MGRSSRQAASDISWDKMAEKAEQDLEIRTRRTDSRRVAWSFFQVRTSTYDLET